MTSGVICQYRDKSFRVRVRYDEGMYRVEQYNPFMRVYEVERGYVGIDSALRTFLDMVEEFVLSHNP